MNDQTLIKVVQESSLEDLTLEEIQQLRSRLADSAEVRAALADRLRMDQHLVDAFGASGDTPDQFIQKVLQRRQKQQSGSWVAIGAITGMLLFGLLGAWAVYQLDILPEREVATAHADATASSSLESLPDQEPTLRTDRAVDANDVEAEDVISIEDAASPTAGLDHRDAPQPSEQVASEAVAENGTPSNSGPPLLTPKDIAPLSFAHLLALPDGDRYDSLTKPELESWLVRASDKLPGEFQEFREGDRPQTRLKGWFRLRGGLPSRAALRLHPSNIEQLRFHFYHGDEGLTVVRHRHDYSPWYAYAMRRGDDGVQPKDLRLQANDHYRDHRSEARNYRPIIFFFDEQTSEIVFHRGDVEVIRARMPGLPQQIFVEGESVLRQLDLLPLAELPQRRPDFPVQATYDRPADLEWQEKLAEGASLRKHADGSLELHASDTKDHSWICLPIPGHGIRMVEVELEGFDKAHSLFLAKAAPPSKEDDETAIPSPQDGIVFSRNQKTEGYFARFSNCFDTGTELDKNPLETPSVEVRRRAWFRLMAGGGQIRGWVSTDGTNWALLSSEDRDTKDLYDYVGISSARLDGDHTLKIRQLRVRELPRLTRLFSPEHWKSVQRISWDQLSKSPTPDEPYTLADGEQIPADLATRLRRFSGTGMSYEAMVALTESVLSQFDSASEKSEAIRELLALTATWPLDHQEKRYLSWCKDELGRQFIGRLSTSDRQDYASFRRELFNLPTIHRDPSEHLSRDRFNAEMLAAIEDNRWNDVLNGCETVRRYHSHDPNRAAREYPILDWAGGVAARHVDRAGLSLDYLSEGRSVSLLVEDLSKEAYNISAELNAALEGGAIADACRLITQVPESATEGLAPSGSDPDHMYSVPAAIQMAVQNHQELQEQMREEYSDLAALRVNAAIQRGDRRVVELVTLQYFDTPAAAQAHLWLGDQATAAGDFATSLQHYLKAARSAEAPLQAEVQTRLLMMGHPPENTAADAVPQGEISLGSRSVAASSMLEATRTILSASKPAQKPSAPSVPQKPVWPEEGSAKATSVKVDWKWGNDTKSVPHPIRELTPDWRGEYLATSVVDESAFVCNRFQVARIDLNDPKVVWKTDQHNKAQGKAHHYPLARCQPLLVNDQVIVRMLHDKGFALYGIDRETGKINWDANLDGKLILATDPVSVQGRTLIVTLREVSQSTYAVRLSRIDLKTGELTESQPLFQVRDTWLDRGIGNLVSYREQLLIDLGGVLASCDVTGHLQWVRKQLTFPQNTDDRWGAQQLSSIVLSGDRGVAFHAGTLRLECFDISTGKLFWTSRGAEIQSISKVDELTFVEEHPTHWSLRSFDTGEILHTREKPEALVHWHLADGRIIGVVKQEPEGDEKREARLQFVRIPFDDSAPVPMQSLTAPHDKQPGIGPVLSGAGRWLFWFSEDRESDRRDLWVVD